VNVKERPRVLHCIPGMGGGGAERQLAYLAGELTVLGWDVHVALVSGGPNLERLRASGATLHVLQAHGNYDPRILVQLLRTVGQVQPDLIQVWVLQMEVLGAVAARLKRVPWILGERCAEDAYPPTVKHRLRTWLATGAAAVISNSAGGDRYWRERLDRRVPRYIIPNALPLIDIDDAAAAGPETTGVAENAKIVLFAGRLIAQKDPETLVQALVPVLARPDVVAVIAGEGPLRERVSTLVNNLRLEDRVLLPGFIGDIWAWMKRADVFVSPTLFEGHPNAVLEAMACGCPLVVSDIPPHREFLDEESARLVPPGDSTRLGEAILEVLTNPDAATRRADRASRIVRKWSLEAIARQYDQAYRELLHKLTAAGLGNRRRLGSS
jgi:glycosyltransferase involved in cell wall biosynthesis